AAVANVFGSTITLDGGASSDSFLEFEENGTLKARIYWDASLSSVKVEIGGTDLLALSALIANIRGTGAKLQINDVQVLTERITGWAAATGTMDRTALAVNPGLTYSNPPTQAEVEALNDFAVDVAQRVGALINDLRTHGIIGT
ncbi:MAG TPA: hypothetical protein VF190_15335, partial [Rhodothermales bacterium]